MILLITEQGATVTIDGGKVVVQTEEITKTLPKELIENVSVFGNVQLSTAFIRHCLSRGIPIAYFSLKGAYFGRTVSTAKDNISRLKKQIYLMDDPSFRRVFAYITLEAKVNNQLTFLRRLQKNNPVAIDEIEAIARLKKKLKTAESVEAAMGYEGMVSRHYYAALSKHLPEAFQFEKRTRRPPRDPFNSMISLGYTILFHEIIGHIESVGLSAYGGIIHGARRSHPSLASDLIEEFRVPIVDTTVVDMILKNRAKAEQFEKEEDGVFLDSALLKEFLNEIQKKLATPQRYLPYLKEPVSYRKAIYNQCRQLVNAIESNDPFLYEPLRIR